jgi:hypothetical protein
MAAPMPREAPVTRATRVGGVVVFIVISLLG